MLGGRLRRAAIGGVAVALLLSGSARAGARASLLVVGDTGLEPRLRLENPQRAVAEAMAAEDRRAPAAALVLLGDNFYPRGIARAELVERVRANLVGPFCRFIAPGGTPASALEGACPLGPAERHVVPIYAVLGNHDYDRPESPGLQRTAVDDLVPNWHMPRPIAETVELDGALSLVLVDSMALGRGQGEPALREALRRSRGPWRVIAAHHPLARLDGGPDRRYQRAVRRAIQKSGVPVHAFLAGHEHNLELLELPGPWPPLLAIAGSGSEVRPVTTTHPGLRFAADELGFARIDVAGEGESEHLAVSLYAVEMRLWRPDRWERVAFATVDREGRVQIGPP